MEYSFLNFLLSELHYSVLAGFHFLFLKITAFEWGLRCLFIVWLSFGFVKHFGIKPEMLAVYDIFRCLEEKLIILHLSLTVLQHVFGNWLLQNCFGSQTRPVCCWERSSDLYSLSGGAGSKAGKCCHGIICLRPEINCLNSE